MPFNPNPKDIGDANYVRCRFRDCHVCCLETEMILTEEEVTRIEENTEYKREQFLLPIKDVDGFLQLRNIESPIGMKCFFLSDKGKCTIREFAPSGCYLYPLILNVETNDAIIDVDCREYEWFKEQTYLEEQVISITQLVTTLLFENEKRIDELNLYSPTLREIEYFEDEETANALKELMSSMEEPEE